MQCPWVRSMCCLDLRDASTTIGALYLIGNLLCVLMAALGLTHPHVIRFLLEVEYSNQTITGVDDANNSLVGQYVNQTAERAVRTNSSSGSPTREQQLEEETAALLLVLQALLVLCALSVPADICLLVGARRRRSSLLLPWLGWYTVATAASTAWSVLLILVTAEDPASTLESWTTSLSWMASAITGWYFYIVVFSYFFDLKKSNVEEYALADVSST